MSERGGGGCMCVNQTGEAGGGEGGIACAFNILIERLDGCVSM